MPIVRVQAVFQGQTQLPEDRFINTFHFHGFAGVGYPEYSALCRLAVGAFFIGTHNSMSVGQLLSPFVESSFQTISYDLEELEGNRVPTADTYTLGARSGEGLPEEVAVCLTLHGEPPITPRRRGRLFIGPLSNVSQVLSNAGGEAPTRVNVSGAQSIGVTLCQAAADMLANPVINWAIRSVTPSENFVDVAGVWVDNALDTQRRRGPDPTARRVMVPGDAGVT